MRTRPETRLRSLETIRLERYAAYAGVCKYYGYKLPDIYEMTTAEYNGHVHHMNKDYEAMEKANAPTRKKR